MAREKPAAGHSGFRKDPGKGRRERLLKPCPPEQRASLFWNAGPCSGVGKEDFFAFFAQSHSKYEQEEQTNMTNLKKKLAVLLALCLMLGALPLSALAARYKLTLADGTEVGELTTDDTNKVTDSTLNAPYDYYSLAPGELTVDETTTELVAYYDGAPTALKFIPRLVSEAAALTFTGVTTGTISGMNVADLMEDITVAPQSGTTLTVTGTAPYFEGATVEKSGHYLFVQITTTANATITLNGDEVNLTAGTPLTAAIELDKGTDGIITVPVKGTSDTYTIDFTGVTLLAKSADGNTSAPAEENGEVIGTKVTDTAGNTVVVPTDSVVDTTEEMVTVAPVTDTTTADKVGIATTGDKKPAEAITSTIVSADKTTLVTVTVTKIDGTPGNQHTADDALASSPLTITIGNLTAGRTYYVFCIRDDGSVTSLGYAKPAATLISFTTTHLCGFGATDITDLPAEEKGALDTAVKDSKDAGLVLTEGEAVVNPAEPVAASAQFRYTVSSALASAAEKQEFFGGKLEVKNTSGADKTFMVAMTTLDSKGNPIKVGDKNLSLTYVKKLADDEIWELPCQQILNVRVYTIPNDTDLSQTFTTEQETPLLDSTASAITSTITE